MSWKKAFFFGGAVLLLSACGDAIAPSSPSALTKLDRASASASKQQNPKPKSPTSSDSTSGPTVPKNCANAVIHYGADGSIIITCTTLE